MPAISWTKPQQDAIRATDRSVLVSAAAGAGKTAVLVERCAYLLADAPPPHRCNADQLLVLTFTDAAAAEMRSRIVEAIREQSSARPDDSRLREQATLMEAAQISTIHAFCWWLIRRWFGHAGVDPAVTLLDAQEAGLLKYEALERLFQEMYEAIRQPGELLGCVEDAASSVPTSLAAGFTRLVQDYGQGEDSGIGEFLLRLHDFTCSLPDPRRWLQEAIESVETNSESLLRDWIKEFRFELVTQRDHVDQLIAALCGRSECTSDVVRLRTYADQLRDWAMTLDPTGRVNPGGSQAVDPLESFKSVRAEMNDFAFPRAARRKKTETFTADQEQSIAVARQEVEQVRDWFERRIQERFGLFTMAESREGLDRIAPYVRTLVKLVEAFADVYAARKQDLNVLDFADLERLAFDLLSEDGDCNQPSGIARDLHRRFVHVLVDEFQDINPLQLALLRLVSRETDPDAQDNLFAVGDVKQSIYRFRLAEPSLFVDRLEAFRTGRDPGLALSLPTNFRSRPEILDAVNTLFRALMRPEWGPIVYDADAELRAGRYDEPGRRRRAIEVHLLEKIPSAMWRTDEDEVGEADEQDGEAEKYAGADYASDPSKWQSIEREAYLIGTRIRDWMQNGEVVNDGRPLKYGDVAILLRAAKAQAEPMAAMLERLGVPAHAEAGGSLLRSREIRDVLAALEVLDNLQQDIPLAAVLRSGVFGERFSADDLVRIRLLDRAAPFHTVVRGYAAEGPDAELQRRLVDVLARIDRFRTVARRRPVAELLWLLYEQTGYLAYAGGLPNGSQRRANLLKLHDLARQFGSFRRQGLRRFLSFVKSLTDEDMGLSAAAPPGHTDDVVRILTMHQAKGLEFPVVFVAGLGARFNLQDARGRMIFERKPKIGLRVIDTARMIEYPSVAHALVVRDIERTTREEEMRVLYVAMTRVRERLILVGSHARAGTLADPVKQQCGMGGPTRLRLATAATPLDWLVPILVSTPAGTVHWSPDRAGAVPLFDVRLHTTAKMSAWYTKQPKVEVEKRDFEVVARLEPLPSTDPMAEADPAVEEVLERMAFLYPHLASSSIGAVQAASEFRGSFEHERNPEERQSRVVTGAATVGKELPPAVASEKAAPRGIATHRVLQHLDFNAARDPKGVAGELERLIGDGLLSEEDRLLLEVEGLNWFVSTPLAEAIRRAGTAYRREFSFIAREPLSLLDRTVRFDPDDYVLVRGIVDGVLSTSQAVEIVDYKTDAIEAEAIARYARRYRSQMEMYARAAARGFHRPVATAWLVFLSARAIVSWRDLDGAGCETRRGVGDGS